jgi:signal peptidase I
MSGQDVSPDRFRVQVQGNSMSPLIEARDTIIAESLRLGRPRRGALIVFRDGESLIVHRVIQKKARDGQGLYCQMGDNGSGFSWIAEKDILGRVLAVVKGGQVTPLEGHVASLAASGIRMIGWAFVQSEAFLNGLQKNWRGDSAGSVLKGIRRLTCAAHHLACRLFAASFLRTRPKSGVGP